VPPVCDAPPVIPDTFPPANGSAAVSPMGGRGGVQGPQPVGEGGQARRVAPVTATAAGNGYK